MDHSPAQMVSILNALGRHRLRDSLEQLHNAAYGAAACQSTGGHKAYQSRAQFIEKSIGD